jgi:hypothetical protein|tara:strand:+ start:2075 stop:2248 length:174 start_codon:yes stop_codon:yes gene_type:complete
MEIFIYTVGIIGTVLCAFAVWERRQNRAMLDRLRSEVLNHQRKNAMHEYHEPGSWRR